jgi:hypothetical protein
MEQAGDEPLAGLREAVSVPSAWKAFRSPSKRDIWRCIPEPSWSSRGFGMKVAWMPSPSPPP